MRRSCRGQTEHSNIIHSINIEGKKNKKGLLVFCLRLTFKLDDG